MKWIDLVQQLGLEDRVLHATAAGNDGLGGRNGGSRQQLVGRGHP